MEIAKCRDQYKGLTYKDLYYFDTACKNSRELEEIDLSNIIRRLK